MLLLSLACQSLGEPVVNGREEIAPLSGTTLVPAKPGKARRGAQFPVLGLLLHGDAKSLAVQPRRQKRIRTPIFPEFNPLPN